MLLGGFSLELHAETGEPLNSAYYSRFYRLADAVAMGSNEHRRGFSDRFLFAAQTTHAKVSPSGLESYCVVL